MINATALYYKYSRVLYTNSRVMYIGKKKKNKIKTLLTRVGKRKTKIKMEVFAYEKAQFQNSQSNLT